MSAKTKPKPAPVRTPAPPADIRPPEVQGAVRLSEIRPCPFNVRRAFDETDLRGLAESIKSIGLKDRLLVRPVGLGGAGPAFDGQAWSGLSHFELVDGERRLRALTILNETHAVDLVPVVVRHMTDDEVRAVMLASREQSRDLAVSELVAGYAELAREKTAEQVASLVGKPVGHVRSVLRLARLPAWALGYVDLNVLPRATAELVARVPGDGSRVRAAACVLQGCHDPKDLTEMRGVEPPIGWAGENPLSYRDTRDLIRDHFTVELKGSPFDRKSLDLLPSAGSCDACPKRAGNDPEAEGEGVRADVCLDPDCYRMKVQAYRTAEIEKAAAKGTAPVPDDFPGMGRTPPRGWIDVSVKLGECPDKLWERLAGNKHDLTIRDALKGTDCPRYVTFSPAGGKPVVVVRTAEARRALTAAGILPKPEKRKAEPKGDIRRCEKCKATFDAAGRSKCPSCSAPLDAEPRRDAPAAKGPSQSDVDDRAAAIAGKVLAEFGEENFDDLDQIEKHTGEHPHTSAVWEAFRFVARFLIRDHIAFGPARGRIVERSLGLEPASTLGRSGVADAEKKLATLGHRAALSLCLRLAAECELQSAPAGPFGSELLEWAELDWPALQAQARRELAGGETADAKIEKAESLLSDAKGKDAT